MVAKANNHRENKVLILMPTGRDAELVHTTLESVGVSGEVCDGASACRSEIAKGVGAILIAEEAVEPRELELLVETLESQPVWSDVPVIIFSSHTSNAEFLLQRLGERINVTIVERPIRITMLISAVRGALRARERQYQARDLLFKLEEADKQKDMFLATLSHELRTPLNSIIGWIQILQTRTLDAQAAEKALEVIERNAKGQAEMISDILFVSRIITGKLEIKHEPIDITSVMNTVVSIIKPSADARSLTLSFDAEEYTAVPVEGDAERLQQVFLNLLTNAVKFTPEGGSITIGLRRSGSNISISIADTGQGINPQFLPYVFERFRQADSTYTRRIGGLGLGLAIVRHLVELHGGSVSAKSDGKDRGATFTVTLPIADSKRVASVTNGRQLHELSDGVTTKVNGMTILLVEDDKDSREMLKVTLELYGIRVMLAETAEEAFEKLSEHRPDVIVSDIGLPEVDGYDLMRKVRSLSASEGGQTPAIALTGYVSVQDKNLALKNGYQEHIPKPVNPHLLLELLARFKSDRGKHADMA